jgi:hypothetical protein
MGVEIKLEEEPIPIGIGVGGTITKVHYGDYHSY